MAWMTKRRLRDEVVRLQYRVAELEERLCPTEKHDYVSVGTRFTYIGASEPGTIYRYKCRRCGRVREDLF